MKHLTIGIFHDETLGRELGKKGTESDILMYNRKTDDCIYTFMAPVGDKITVKSQIALCIDAAIVVCQEMTPEVGETILLLDAAGIKNGMIVIPPFSEQHRVSEMIMGTSLASFSILERNIPLILSKLESFSSTQNIESTTVVVVDHSFSVKGVGEVILGFVKQGVVHKHDKLVVLPNNKEVIVRSIQMQDKEFEEAAAGSRVGLSIKDATIDDLSRGAMLCAPQAAFTASTVSLSFMKNRYYPALREGLFHLIVGMQMTPATIVQTHNGTLSLRTEKQIGYRKGDLFILLDLNARKLHFMGSGKVAI
jgi:selenocysteine-specific translation elongation factor